MLSGLGNPPRDLVLCSKGIERGSLKLMTEVLAETIQGGSLKSKKGVNLPNTRVSLPCLTPKDLADLEVALDENVDWIGLSFVRSAQDIHELRRILDARKHHAGIIAKIEKPEAVADVLSMA